MSNANHPRRRVLTWTLGALGLAAAKPVLAATPTSSATEGPFYHSRENLKISIHSMGFVAQSDDAAREAFYPG